MVLGEISETAPPSMAPDVMLPQVELSWCKLVYFKDKQLIAVNERTPDQAK